MDFLIQTAWYSIELHGHAMAFHETASVLQGTPWHSMELYNIPWNSMDLQGNSMEFHGIPWNCITTSWNSVELHGIPWNSMDAPWNSMAFHGTTCILHGYSVEFHGFSWNSIIPWNSMEVFHTGSARIIFHQSLISGCYAILTSPKEGETAVYGYNTALC